MISPFTPPGTHLVVVWCPKSFAEALTLVHPDVRYRVKSDWNWRDPFKEGDRFVLDHIEREPLAKSGYCVYLMGIPVNRFAIEQFRVAVLPNSLTDILSAVPADQDVVMPCDC